MTNQETMKSDWIRAADVTSIVIGDQIVSACGMEIKVTNLLVMQLHFPQPTVLVSYSWNDNGRTGSDQVEVSEFYNVIHS